MRQEDPDPGQDLSGLDQQDGSAVALGSVLEPFSPMALHVHRATGEVVGRVRRISGLVEEIVSGPLVKLISLGVGVRRATSRFGGKGGKGGKKGSA